MQENQFQRFENLLEEFKQYIERVHGELKKFNVASTEVDVLEFEGKQYRRVYRKAKPGDVVILRGDNLPEWFTKGKAYKINKFGKIDECDSGYRDYDVYKEQYGRTTENVDVYEPIQQEKSPNQLRKEIIEKAKEFVENILGEYETFRITIGKYKTVFRVNTNKRAVTALIYGAFSKEPVFKGIAKCHPDDVFNEHIGKAIALGRALGLDVSEFEQAVQPTEVVVGHKVSNKYDDEINRITEIIGTELRVDGTKNYWPKKSVNIGMISIIDDTNAIYEVNES